MSKKRIDDMFVEVNGVVCIEPAPNFNVVTGYKIFMNFGATSEQKATGYFEAKKRGMGERYSRLHKMKQHRPETD